MHDPHILTFQIKSPFFRRRVLPNGRKYREHNTLVSVWHVDPETDGSDDSCGWSAPKLSDRDKKIINEIVDWDNQFNWFTSPFIPSVVVDPKYDYHQQQIGDALGHVASAWQMIAWRRDRRRRLTTAEWWEVVSLATNPTDNLRASLVDNEQSLEAQARHFVWCVMRDYLRFHRPWWKHPRWHFWHWELQIHPLQNLKRWLFSRCDGCGKRFGWGESPTCSSWNSSGPLWFKGEKNIYHSGCYGHKVRSEAR